MKIKKLTFLLMAFASINSFASDLNLTCVGTEPFWEINISSGKQMRLIFAGASGKDFNIIENTSAEGTSGDYAIQLRGISAQSDLIKLNIIKSECNDGMSERIYPFNVLVEQQNQILYGCCQ